MEDDIEVLRWPSRAVLEDAPPGWGALQLYMLGNAANKLYSSPPGRWVPWAPGLFNTGAYIINRTGMQRVGAPLELGTALTSLQAGPVWQSLGPPTYAPQTPGDCRTAFWPIPELGL